MNSSTKIKSELAESSAADSRSAASEVHKGNHNDTSTKVVKKMLTSARKSFKIPDYILVITSADKETLFKCIKCEKAFKTKANIKYHKYCLAEEMEKPLKCDGCEQGFVSKSHYDYHMRTHTGERPFVCKECNKGFLIQSKLNRHMLSHELEKRFKCTADPSCKKAFKSPQGLKMHMSIHAADEAHKPKLQCIECGRPFFKKKNLKKHMLIHRAALDPDEPSDCLTTYKCSYCQKAFECKDNFKAHIKLHESECTRPHKCDQCEKAFAYHKDLIRHTLIHSGEKMFKCLVCTTAFLRKDNLMRHIKKTHNLPESLVKQLAEQSITKELAMAHLRSLPDPVPEPTSSNRDIETIPRNSTQVPSTPTRGPLPDMEIVNKDHDYVPSTLLFKNDSFLLLDEIIKDEPFSEYEIENEDVATYVEVKFADFDDEEETKAINEYCQGSI